MKDYKKDFIGFMIDSKVLKFGSFVTKSGRKTPFFINAGGFSSGAQLSKLGEFYAQCIMDNFENEIKEGMDVLFGPAYKGIPLSVTTAGALYQKFDVDVRFASDRKEAKDHGEGGKLLGGPINEGDRVMIIEDVTTAGTSIKETYPIITSRDGVKVFGLVIAVDRMERGDSDISALEQIQKDFGFKAAAIVTMEEVVEFLYNKPYKGEIIIDDDLKAQIDEYYKQYGAK